MPSTRAPKSALDRVDGLFNAFADRTRLRILNLLREGEVCVCELVRVLKSPQPKVSRHLAYLRKAGLVLARRDGPWMHYRLAPATDPFHRSLVGCLSDCFAHVPELSRDLKLLKRASVCDETCGPECR
jgi:ArsR family transcriptional regulator, arsenate/arsenite/antimonite-responsive transcriptional repressor